MPYVSRETRVALDAYHTPTPRTPGELAYCVTELVQKFLGEEPTFTGYAAAIGVLECAKLELYRRRIAEYEDGKIAENGDVY